MNIYSISNKRNTFITYTSNNIALGTSYSDNFVNGTKSFANCKLKT